MGGTVQDAHTRRVISRRAARAHGNGDEGDGAVCRASTEEDGSGRASAPLASGELPAHDPGTAARTPDEQRTASPRQCEVPCALPLEELPRTPPEPQPTSPAAEEHAKPDPGGMLEVETEAVAPADPVEAATRPGSPQIASGGAMPEPPMAPFESKQSAPDQEPAIQVADDEPADRLKDIKSPAVAASLPQRRCIGRAANYDHIKSRLFEITAASKAKIVSSERGRRTQGQTDSNVMETCQPTLPTVAVLRPGCADTAAATPVAPKSPRQPAWLGKTAKATGTNLANGLVGNGAQSPGMRGHLNPAAKLGHPWRPSTQCTRPKSLFLSKGPQPSPFGLGSSLTAIDAESFLRGVLEGGKTIRQATDGQRQPIPIFPAQ
jgi:hypothetical protein